MSLTQNITLYLDTSGNTSTTASAINKGSSDNCSISNMTLSRYDFDCSDVGTNTIYLSVTDVNGNIDSTSAVVTVKDQIKPDVITQNITLYLDTSGNASTTASAINKGSSDNCSIDTMSLTRYDFECSDVGTNTIYLRVTDVNGNTDSASAEVTVIDQIKPTVITQNITLYLDTSGNTSTTASAIDNGSSDNCSISNMTLSQSSFDCSDVGTNTIYLRVTDVNGNIDSASAVVTVIDQIKPTVITQNITLYLDASGQAVTGTAQIDNGSSDNCSIGNMTLSQSSFDCSDAGTNTIWLYVTDVNGNIDSASAVVDLRDTIKPKVRTQNRTVYLNTIGLATMTADSINNGSSDNCAINNTTLSQYQFKCTEVGPNTIYLIATDDNGNTDSTSAVVTVIDTLRPDVTTQNITLYLDTSGNTSTTASAINKGSLDNCSISNMTLSRYDFDCSDVGTNTIYLSVTDVNGNIDSTSAVVTVKDQIKPDVITQNITLYLDTSGNASTTASAINKGSSDNCSIDTMSLTRYDFECSDVGTNTIYLRVTDVNGNTDSASAEVTVIDQIKPTVITQNITLYLDTSGNTSTTASAIDNGSSDNCSISNMTLSQSSFDCSDVGTNTIYLRVTDVNGNIDSASAVVTVIDQIKPTVITQNITLYLDASGQAVTGTAQIDNGSSDNCSIGNMTLSQSSFDCSDAGTNTIWLYVTDVNGNIDSASAVVDLRDTIKPKVRTQNRTVYLNTIGLATMTADSINNGSSDNCAINNTTLSQYQFKCTEVGPNTIYLIATDDNGNTDSTSAVVTVIDTLRPDVTTQNITLYLDTSGNTSTTASAINKGSSDNCSISNMTLSRYDFDCSDVGTNTIYLSVTDVNGNIDSTSAVVTVKDQIKPDVITQNITLYLDTSGNASTTASAINKGSSDNCSIDTMSLTRYDFECSDVGTNTIYLRVTDVNGNTDSASAEVTVIDQIKPTVITQNITLYLDVSGQAVTGTAQIDKGSSDNCSIGNMTLSQSSFDCSDAGTNTIWLYVTDVNGNIDSASAVVTVKDTTKPIVRTANLALYLDTSGKVSVTTKRIDNSSSDNCAIDTMSLSKYDFDCSEVGANTIFLRVTDVNGNIDSTSTVVTLIDTLRPDVTTQNITLYLDTSGNTSTTASAINKGSSDNCAISNMTLSQSSFDCSEVGNNNVWLIVTDVNGNIDSASAVVTVKDTTAPTFIDFPSDFAFGYCDAQVTYVAPTGDDNCSYTITQTAGLASGEIFPVGLTLNEFLIQDPSGNVDSISFKVAISGEYLPFTLEDTTLCKNHKWLNLSKETSSILFDGTGVMSDGITYNPLDGDLGVNAVNATFTDSMGCVTTGSFAILLLDVPKTPEIERIASSEIQVKNGPYNSYQWYLDGTLIPQDTNRELRALQLGEYMVVVGNAQSCFAVSMIYTFGFDYESADILDEGNIKVFPNPNSGIFFVQFDDDQETHQLELISSTGKVLLSKETSSKVQRLDIKHLPTGNYLLRASSATSSKTFQIIKK